MSEKAVLSLNGNSPDAAEVFNFLNILFGTNWPRGVDEKISEFVDLVYIVTRQAGLTIYQDAESNPVLKQDQGYAASFDETRGAWLVIVANGKEYVGTMDALRFISTQPPCSELQPRAATE
ncbi:hypothetical protein SDC9_146689 [bioreactor metagenome]|uniref:Uncharacterized protein n=1 Tax=bioreactor metagenome TaxID=1076179 RepID=A0A645EBZ8_9ZZZZ